MCASQCDKEHKGQQSQLPLTGRLRGLTVDKSGRLRPADLFHTCALIDGNYLADHQTKLLVQFDVLRTLLLVCPEALLADESSCQYRNLVLPLHTAVVHTRICGNQVQSHDLSPEQFGCTQMAGHALYRSSFCKIGGSCARFMPYSLLGAA